MNRLAHASTADIRTLAFVGVAIGGYLFRDAQPRSFLALTDCRDSCYRSIDFAGMLVSAGIQKVAELLPLVVRETDGASRSSIRFPVFKHHFVVFPKRDVKDIADISVEDGPGILECFEHIRWLVTHRELPG